MASGVQATTFHGERRTEPNVVYPLEARIYRRIRYFSNAIFCDRRTIVRDATRPDPDPGGRDSRQISGDSLSSLTHDCVPLRCRTHRSTELRGLSRNCQKCPIAIATERGGESAVPAPPPPPARHVCALPRRRFIFANSLRLLDTAQVPGRERPSQHAAATRAACVSPGGLKPSESLPP